MSSLNQTIILNTDLFPLGAAINKSFQKTVEIDGNSTLFGTISLDPTPLTLAIEPIELSPIDDRAIVFLQADAGNGTDLINIGLWDSIGGTFDSLFQMKAGEVALFPFKYTPAVAPANPLRLAVTLDGTPVGTTDRLISFAILETA